MIRGVVFDIGETLIDETRLWTTRATDCGIAPFTFMATLGAVIERGESHRRVWDVLGVPEPTAPPTFGASDLYPDAIECISRLKTAGFRVGIAGNQPESIETHLRTIGLDTDFIASSSRWGVHKPSPMFFHRIATEAKLNPEEILYVGDRVDNDLIPARAAGMRTAFIRRGPWAHIHPASPLHADIQIASLDELPLALTHIGSETSELRAD